MTRTLSLRSTLLLAVSALALIPYWVLATQPAPKAPVEPAKIVDFERDLMPIVKAKCIGCHSQDDMMGGLALDTPKGWQDGGVSGKLFVAGKSAKSLLIERLITKDKGKRMPVGMPALKPAEVKLFQDWVDQGAHFQLQTFERDLKALFKAKCSTCHEGDAAAAGLNLYDLDSVRKRTTGKDPEKSVLVRRIKGLDGKPRMPMGFKALEPNEIKIVEDWIRQGTPKGEAAAPSVHWAYRPLTKPEVPEAAWGNNPIDAFIAERLRKEGLQPSEPAPKEKLLRRLTLDLTGLPPTLAELDAFATGKETTEQAIDRLLKSPHFGERMAVPWLDLARYADTNGYEKDGTRSAWLYRDWVINAFNQNLPYNDFTVQQLAGDLLPSSTVEQKIATGFHRNSMLNLEGGVDQEEAMYIVRYDRTDTTSTVWLGQTMACARCHDHKYDPISHKDYFRFYAFFANNKFDKLGDPNISEQKYIEPSMRVMPADAEARAVALRQEIPLAQAAWQRQQDGIAKEQEEWEKSATRSIWTPVKAKTSDPGLQVLTDKILAVGPSPVTAAYTFELDLPAGTRALRLGTIPDPARPNGGPGRADSGNFILSKIVLSDGKVVSAAADYVQAGYSAEGVLDDNPESGWAISGSYPEPHEIVFELDKPISGRIAIRLQFDSTRWPNHTLGSFTLSSTTELGSTRYVLPADVRKILGKAERTPEEQNRLKGHFGTVALTGRAERQRLSQLQNELRSIEGSAPTALVMVEDTGKTEAPIRHRGEFLSPTEVVPAGTPSAFGEVRGGNRLDLAKWIVEPKNPLTARVQVNRLWEMVFGRGLVETSENFGTQGTPPSHPELLDWLASTYVESGWDTKALLKLIVSSATYQQTSASTRALNEKDPNNVLLARGPRFRLTAEFVRDQALALAGLLSPKLGGPSVYPYQPEGVWNSPYSGEQWMPSKGEDAYRRSLYTFWKRTAPYPIFLAFDGTSREQCTVRRSRTNTPLQALATLNDPGLYEAAKAFGKRAQQVSGPLEERLKTAFRMATARVPDDKEVARLKALYDKTATSKGEEAAWTLVANVLLNLDEAITKE